MTTVAAKDGVMACDSQVTGSFGCPAQKIRKSGDIIIGFAGDWIAGAYFADYYLNPLTDPPERDSDDDIDLLVLKPSGIYLVDYRFREVRICGHHYAIGSGAQAAMVAMNMGADAKEAIKQAMKVDDWTGGRVRSLSIA